MTWLFIIILAVVAITLQAFMFADRYDKGVRRFMKHKKP